MIDSKELDYNDLENESKLVKLAMKNDWAFEILYNRYFSEISGYIYKRVGSRETAEDIVSVTFMKVFSNLGKYKNNSFRAWVYRIATNNLIDYYRKNNKVIEVDIDDGVEIKSMANTPMDDILNKQDREKIEKTLNTLSGRYKEILYLKFFGELEVVEISKVMNISVGNVSVLTNRALKSFQKKYIK